VLYPVDSSSSEFNHCPKYTVTSIFYFAWPPQTYRRTGSSGSSASALNHFAGHLRFVHSNSSDFARSIASLNWTFFLSQCSCLLEVVPHSAIWSWTYLSDDWSAALRCADDASDSLPGAGRVTPANCTHFFLLRISDLMFWNEELVDSRWISSRRDSDAVKTLWRFCSYLSLFLWSYRFLREVFLFLPLQTSF